MARRDENECAHCAETMTPAARLIGKDWKVYCSPACRQIGESDFAQEEAQRRMLITERKINFDFTMP